MRTRVIALVLAGLVPGIALGGRTPAELKIVGDWEVAVTLSEPRRITATLRVPPPAMITVVSERFDSLPLLDPKVGGTAKGAPLAGVRAQEATTPYLLDPASLVIRAGAEPDADIFRAGEDYAADSTWGTVGRLPSGRIKAGQPIFASYRHGLLRLDAIVLTRAGRLVLRPGEPRAAAPVPPKVADRERHLANIWLPGRISRLDANHLFPILETAYPEPPRRVPSVAETLLPKTMAKLRSGGPLRILAWGDSVTYGSNLPDRSERWQEQFVARLRRRFPRAHVDLFTEAWGGNNTVSYLRALPGSPHNFREKVLGANPDLIVSEFVNDAVLTPAQVAVLYGNLLAGFQSAGVEWIILTPHYVRPDWMGLTRERDVDDDPRPYVQGVRQFAAAHDVALADAALRYGRLWRQGLPHSTFLLNSVNHPDVRGMRLFADALMELFP